MPHRESPGSLRRRARVALGAGLAIAALTLGCGDDPTGPPPGEVMPDFSLQDVNPNSKTHDQQVTPRGYLQQISAWYFGHAT